MAAGTLLPETSPGDLLARRRDPVDPETMARAARIVEDVRTGGFGAVRARAQRHDGLAAGEPLLHEQEDLAAARDELPDDLRRLFERAAERIARFAEAQRGCFEDLATTAGPVAMGHRVVPLERAGCYAPGGRRPYVSSVLMTVTTARVAGVREIWLASPRPGTPVLAAAAIAGADAVLGAGGAHAIAALAFGAGPVPACDAVVGPGGPYVVAAKRLVAGIVRTDGPTGPAELVLVADGSVDPEIVAADLLAVAEHDEAAVPLLLTPDQALVGAVRKALGERIGSLEAAETARRALQNGRTVLVTGLEEALDLIEALAPESVALHVADPEAVRPRLARHGTLVAGVGSPAALVHLGVGPNHALPGGGAAARFTGLSVATFLRFPSWLAVSGPLPEELADDLAALARLEGLDAHALALALRAGGVPVGSSR
ncbi:MAG: histidinol dehydrogenase [Acidobacteriota bacterium]